MVFLMYVTLWIIFIIICTNIYLYKYNKNIFVLEKKLSNKFDSKFGLVPSFFEISKKLINKHSDVFFEILKIYKLDSTIYDMDMSFQKRYYIISFLNHELDFLFKIFKKHPKIINDYKFKYLKNIYIDNNIEIWKEINLYEKNIKKYNYLVKLNNIFLIWYLIPSNIEKQ